MSDNRNLPSQLEPATPPAQPLAYPAFAEEDEEKSGLGPKRYLLAVLRYKWLVLALAVVGTAGSVVASKYVKLRYNASARVIIERDPSIGGAGPIRSSQLLPNDSWVELLRTFEVMDSVVLRQRLYLTYQPADAKILSTFDLRRDTTRWLVGEVQAAIDPRSRTIEVREPNTNRVLDRVAFGDTVGNRLGWKWTPPESELTKQRVVQFTVDPPREMSNQLLRGVSSLITRNGVMMQVSYSDTDPRRVAAIVNGVVDRFVEVATEMKTAKIQELTRILEGQLAYADGNLQAAESALQNFLVETITLPTEPTTPVPASDATRSSLVSSYFATRIQRETLRREREALEKALSAASRGDSLSLDALSVVAAAQQSPELGAALGQVASSRAALRALQQQYTDEFHLVQKAKADLETLERETVPQLGRRLIAELENREAELQVVEGASSSELREIPPRVIEQGRLQRQMATADRLATDLRNRVETARLAAATTLSDVRILDRASPPRRPALDQRMRIVLLGLVGSLGFGLMLALMLDRMDPRLRYAEQVTDDMGLSIVGAVPSLARPKVKGLSSAPSGPEVLESLRSLRLSLMHAYGSAGPIIITISSPGSGDGKTFVTSNLGLTFADLGLKTLLVDGDTRRGTLHRLFGINRKPGLTDFLVGTETADSIVYSTKFPNVDIIPSGSRQTNAPELLASQSMGDLLARIRAEYQVILIDSPPLGAGVDPLVLATLSGNLLLVMRTGVTQRSMAEAKLKMIDRLPIRLLGTVLNGYDAGESYRYYSYMPGYETRSEETQDSELLPA